ncbi:MAG: beta-propeller domain-containing protein [Sphingomonadaceae bacterium]|nr:beta-propeller domain-containing protein [Sphingomonadaceae bacterium]
MVAAPSAAAPAPPQAGYEAQGNVVVTGTRTASPNLANTQPTITNNQEANVDEGDIVKTNGEFLVILRRGRLFTVSLGGGRMRPVDTINAFPPGVSGQGDWYDEMLLNGDWVVVVGYSYERGGTEINRFRLDPGGGLRFVDSYHLKSNDYYSDRNYASRLIGTRLIFYTPLELGWEDDPLEALPGLRRWQPGDAEDKPFRRIAPATQVYIAPRMRDDRDADIDTLHSVTTCDLVAPVLDCSAVAVLGPESRTFYVSADAVYLWVADWTQRDLRRGEPEAFLYRLPFGRERPSAIGTHGSPVDQFSFREDAPAGVVNVLVRKEGGGDAMFHPEISAGGVALLRLPIAALGDGSRQASDSFYRWLPSPGDADEWNFHNRFVGDHVLYGAGGFGDEAKTATLFVAPLRGGATARIQLSHAVDRIDLLGRDGVVIGEGAGGRLGFTAIELPPRAAPVRGDVFTLPAASEGETRSHAFFFRPNDPEGASGLLGLPISRSAPEAYRRFFGSAASMLFLRRDNRRFARGGELDSHLEGVVDDACKASCTDWYGNARPIFLGNRVFALLGYELVEGRMENGRIGEIGRVNFAPSATQMQR